MLVVAFKKLVGFFALVAFIVTSVVPPSYAQSVLFLPEPGTMVSTSPVFNPALLQGVTLDPKNPFNFNFILDMGESTLSPEQLKNEGTKLVRYFMAALTLPEKDLWVNLSPYEKDRILTNEFSLTEMGRDLLAQDYILKQITSSLMYPENGTGKEFWARVYAQAYDKYGTTDVSMDTFNKVWIVPDKAVVYEDGNRAFIVESTLRVMLEEDYLALEKNAGADGAVVKSSARPESDLPRQIMREVIVPVLEKEVNEGAQFASLRQIYQSVILAKWYKQNIKDSIINVKYTDQKKVLGVDLADKADKQAIFERYIEAFKKGAFNYIKDEYDAASQELIPRKYFSGGAELNPVIQTTREPSSLLSRIRKGLPGANILKFIVFAVTLNSFSLGANAGGLEAGRTSVVTEIVVPGPERTSDVLAEVRDRDLGGLKAMLDEKDPTLVRLKYENGTVAATLIPAGKDFIISRMNPKTKVLEYYYTFSGREVWTTSLSAATSVPPEHLTDVLNRVILTQDKVNERIRHLNDLENLVAPDTARADITGALEDISGYPGQTSVDVPLLYPNGGEALTVSVIFDGLSTTPVYKVRRNSPDDGKPEYYWTSAFYVSSGRPNVGTNIVRWMKYPESAVKVPSFEKLKEIVRATVKEDLTVKKIYNSAVDFLKEKGISAPGGPMITVSNDTVRVDIKQAQENFAAEVVASYRSAGAVHGTTEKVFPKVYLNFFGPGSDENGPGEIKIMTVETLSDLISRIDAIRDKGIGATYLYRNILETINVMLKENGVAFSIDISGTITSEKMVLVKGALRHLVDNINSFRNTLFVITDGRSDRSAEKIGPPELGIPGMKDDIIQKAKDGDIRIIYVGVGEARESTVSDLIERSQAEGFSFQYIYAEDHAGLRAVVENIVNDAVAAESEGLISLDLPGNTPSSIKVFDGTGELVVHKDMVGVNDPVQADPHVPITTLNNQGSLRLRNGEISGKLYATHQGSPVNFNDYELVNGLFESKESIKLAPVSEESAIFVIDDSGTMRQDRVSGGKKKIDVVRALLPGIQAFFKSGDKPVEFGEGGGTPGWGATSKVLNNLKDIKQNKGKLPSRVFVITDGLFNDAPPSAKALMELAVFCFDNRIKLSVLGIGPDFTSFRPGLENIRPENKFLAPGTTSIQRLFELSAATRGLFIAVDAENIEDGFEQLKADLSGWAKVPGPGLDNVKILLRNKETGVYLEVTSKILIDGNVGDEDPFLTDPLSQIGGSDKAALTSKGGIDLDPGLIELRRQGSTAVDWALSAKQFEDLEIFGLVPVVNQMIPVSAADLTFLMGRDR